MNPSWRKPFGMFLILLLITVWVIIIASFSAIIAGFPGIIQAIIYAVSGVIWIFPLKPLLAWMETGNLR